MSRKPKLPKGFFLWSESLRRKWVDEYNARLPEINEGIRKRNEVNSQRRENDRSMFRDAPTPSGYQWLNCETNPRKPATGFDAGRTAWKFHAVLAEAKESFQGIGNRRAACGITPYYGWTLDLFMDEGDSVGGKCIRCMRKLFERGNGERCTTHISKKH